jgi:PleD family two-component response regulator
MGIASYPANGDSRNALLRAADTAMYAAKHAGRDDIRSFDQIEAISK